MDIREINISQKRSKRVKAKNKVKSVNHNSKIMMEEVVAITGGAEAGKHLEKHGLKNLGAVHWNLSAPALYQEAIARGEGTVTVGGALTVSTGVHTGRSPNDKFIVDSPTVHEHIDLSLIHI